VTRGRAEARRALLRRLIGRRAVRSQQEAATLLERRGHRVTQATVSRDLDALGAVKAVDPDGSERYALPETAPGSAAAADDGQLARLLRQFVLELGDSGNLALLKTEPGAAGPVASALDRTALEEVLGTVAGDDTVLIVARASAGGAAVCRRLEELMEGETR